MSAFKYVECPECGFDHVLRSAPTDYGVIYCSMCAEDNGRDVRMCERSATDHDDPEGQDDKMTGSPAHE